MLNWESMKLLLTKTRKYALVPGRVAETSERCDIRRARMGNKSDWDMFPLLYTIIGTDY